jgi:hypothetical protein
MNNLNKILIGFLISSTALAASPTRLNDVVVRNQMTVGSTTTAATSAALDLISTTRGFNPPRMTTSQRDAIASPTAGMLIYNTTTSAVNVYSGTAWGAISGGGGLYQETQNLLTNSSWESDTSGWTASAGTYTRVTAAASIVPPGIGAGSWDPSASGQTLTSNTITITSADGLSGRSGTISCAFKTTATDLQMQAYDGTNVLTPSTTTDIVPANANGFSRYTLNFVFPTSGTTVMRFKSQSDSAVAIVDQCYFGLAEGFNAFLGSYSTPWAINSMTFTPNNFGTTTATTTLTRRTVDKLEVILFFTAGTAAASTGSISLPSGLVIDSTKLPSSGQVVGEDIQMATGTIVSNRNSIFYDGSDTAKVYFASSVSGTAYVKLNANSVIASSTPGQFYFSVPVTSYTDQPFFLPQNTPASWSGYSAAISGGCTTSSSTYADPAACTNIAVTQTTTRNITCVQNSTLPSISCTLPKTGMYRVSANTVTTTVGAGTGTNSVRLVDGSATIIDPGRSGQLAAAGPTLSLPLSGIYNVTSVTSATVFKVQLATTAATSGEFAQGTASGSGAIQWDIVELDAPMSSPYLTGSVVTGSSGIDRIERVVVTPTCTSSPCSAAVGTSGISSVTRTATGRYVINFVSGTYSGNPICFGLQNESTTYITEGLASSSIAHTFNCTNTSASAVDCVFSAVCIGPH